MVGGQIGLTFRTVDKQEINLLVLGRGELDMRRKRRAAHANQTAFKHGVQRFFRRDGIQIARFGQAFFRPFVRKVVLDGDAGDHVAAHHEMRRNLGHRAGDRSVHRRRDEGARLPDLLSTLDMLADCDAGDAGRADVLRHRNADGLRCGHWLDGKRCGEPLALAGAVQRMNTAAESSC